MPKLLDCLIQIVGLLTNLYKLWLFTYVIFLLALIGNFLSRSSVVQLLNAGPLQTLMRILWFPTYEISRQVEVLGFLRFFLFSMGGLAVQLLFHIFAGHKQERHWL